MSIFCFPCAFVTFSLQSCNTLMPCDRVCGLAAPAEWVSPRRDLGVFNPFAANSSKKVIKNNFPRNRASRPLAICAFRLRAFAFPAPATGARFKMAREDRFYAFIIAHTSRSRAKVQRIRVDKRSVSIFFASLLLLGVGIFYGLYGLTQQASYWRTHFENQRLRAENERQRQELEKLNNRVEKVEDTSRKLAEKSGVVDAGTNLPGTGGPALPMDEMAVATLAAKMSRLEEDMRGHEAILRKRGYTPTVWPVEGTLEAGFGGRRNPFGGGGYEFHSGQDIEAPWGAPVVAGASGRVSFRRLAKRLWTASRHRPWRWLDHSIRPSVTHRCRKRTNGRASTVSGQSRLNRSIHRTTSSLRGPYQRSARKSPTISFIKQ